MSRTSTYPLVDRLLDGKLGEILLAWEREGDKPESIAYRLRSEHDVVISSSTARRWLDRARDAAEVAS